MNECCRIFYLQLFAKMSVLSLKFIQEYKVSKIHVYFGW